jgi:hypothetical protein
MTTYRPTSATKQIRYALRNDQYRSRSRIHIDGSPPWAG